MGFAGLVIITIAGGIIIAKIINGSDVDRGIVALIEAFSNRRVIEPRLSGGFKCGEFKACVEDMAGVNTDKFERARELITDAAARGDSAADLAYARLLLSRARSFPKHSGTCDAP